MLGIAQDILVLSCNIRWVIVCGTMPHNRAHPIVFTTYFIQQHAKAKQLNIVDAHEEYSTVIPKNLPQHIQPWCHEVEPLRVPASILVRDVHGIAVVRVRVMEAGIAIPEVVFTKV